MTLLGFDVPTFLVVKAGILIVLAACIGLYEGWTGKRLFRRDNRGGTAPQHPPKHMGEAEEVKRPK